MAAMARMAFLSKPKDKTKEAGAAVGALMARKAFFGFDPGVLSTEFFCTPHTRIYMRVCCSVLQCVAVCCSLCVAVCRALNSCTEFLCAPHVLIYTYVYVMYVCVRLF